jgi:TNF receptor-associated factor 4
MIYLMSGVYDDLLEWPFCGYISIEILNQLEDDHHFRRVFRYNRSHHYGNRVIGCERAETGRGKNEFISYSQLHIDSSINCQYLKDDTLYFRVRIEVPSNTKPWLIT